MHTTHSSKQESGFSLIELLIVVLIVSTLAAIAIPNFLESKQAAHNASALSSLRLIHSAEALYRASHDQYADLATLGTGNYLSDPALVSGQRSNYTFRIPNTFNADFYEATAAPNVAPWRFYYMDVSGVIRSNLGGVADATSPPINY